MYRERSSSGVPPIAVILAIVAVLVCAIAILIVRWNVDAYPVVPTEEWQKVLSDAIQLDESYRVGIVKAANKYLEKTNQFRKQGDIKLARQAWIVAHLLSWYGNELSVNAIEGAGLPSSSPLYAAVLKNQELLLENRELVVNEGALTFQILRQNFENMNQQLELLGRTKCRSLVIERL